MTSAVPLSEPAPRSTNATTTSLRVPQGMLRARTFVQTLAAESWRGLFEMNHEALVDASVDGILARLEEGVVDDIIDALEFIHTHAEDGLDTVLELVDAAGIQLSSRAMGRPAADMLAELWIQSKADPRLQRVLVAAQLEAAAREGKRTRYRYVPREDGKMTWEDGATSRLREHLSGLFEVGGLTGNVTIDTQQMPGHVSLYVLRGTRRQRLPLMDDASGITAPSNIRAASCDLIFLDLNDARIELMPSDQRLAETYARILGEVIFGRPDAFVVEESFNLGALLQSGRSLTIQGRPDVSVRLESIEWEPVAGERMTARGRDCLSTLVRELKHLGEQHVLRARFAFHFKKTRRRVGVSLKPPHGIRCTRESDRLELEDLFRRLGLLGRSLAAPFWEFASRPRPAPRWRRALRDRFDQLLKDGFLLDARLDAASDGFGWGPDGALRPVEGLDHVGVGIDRDVPAGRLMDDALDGYRLNVATLVNRLQKLLKLTDTPFGLLPDGLVQIGRRQMRAQVLRVFLALAPPGDLGELAAALRSRVHGERLVLLAPSELQDNGTIDVVPLQDWIPPFGDLVEHFYGRLDLRAEMDLDETAGKARVVVRTEGVYLDGKMLDLKPQHIEFVRLVIAHGPAMSKSQLGDRLRVAGRGVMASDTIAHQARQAVANAMTEALTRQPRSPETEVEQLLKTHRGRGYEFLVEAVDLSERPLG